MRCFTLDGWKLNLGIKPQGGTFILGKRGEGCHEERIRFYRYCSPNLEDQAVLRAGLKYVGGVNFSFWVIESEDFRNCFWLNYDLRINRNYLSIHEVNADGVLIFFRAKTWKIVLGSSIETVEGWDASHREVLVQFEGRATIRIETENDGTIYLVYEPDNYCNPLYTLDDSVCEG